MKKVTSKRKRPMNPDLDESPAYPKNAKVDPPVVMNAAAETLVLQEIIPNPHVQCLNCFVGSKTCIGTLVAQRLQVVASRLHIGCMIFAVAVTGYDSAVAQIGSCIQAVSEIGCTNSRLHSSGVMRGLQNSNQRLHSGGIAVVYILFILLISLWSTALEQQMEPMQRPGWPRLQPPSCKKALEGAVLLRRQEPKALQHMEQWEKQLPL